jgi:membrane protein DedA with SNARE-associated domain
MEHLLDTYGYIVVFGFIFIEACGVPLPGEIMLITAAAYAGTGHMQIQFVIGAAILGAILGFVVSYAIGRTGGRAVIDRYGRYIRLDMDHLDATNARFRRFGDAAVFIGRFVAGLRAWAAFFAGLNRMPVPKFMLFNVAGGVVWALLYGFLAFKFGKPVIELIVRYISFALLAAVLIAIGYGLYRWRSNRADPAST